MARALAVRAETRMRSGNLEGAEMDLEMIDGVLDAVRTPRCQRRRISVDLSHSQAPCPETVDAQRLHADLFLRQEMAAEAHQGYLEAQKSLDVFVHGASDDDPATRWEGLSRRSLTKLIFIFAALRVDRPHRDGIHRLSGIRPARPRRVQPPVRLLLDVCFPLPTGSCQAFRPTSCACEVCSLVPAPPAFADPPLGSSSPAA